MRHFIGTRDPPLHPQARDLWVSDPRAWVSFPFLPGSACRLGLDGFAFPQTMQPGCTATGVQRRVEPMMGAGGFEPP
jgi:hypothetical protein